MQGFSKVIFITGGVVSSLGKGITGASIGALLEAHGFSVSMLKMDPYINVDPGTMSPFQHGEVFVTDDGAETDLDLGHYERFVGERLSKKNSFSAGQVYQTVLDNERRGDYLGKTVQVIPHITDEIKRRILLASDLNGQQADVVIAEVGGTIGDIESLPFQEAIRQLHVELGHANTVFIHVTLLPFVRASGEVKTKPTQHSVKELRSIGIQPDFLICRSEQTINTDLKEKIALFTNVSKEHVFSAEDVDTIYRLPQYFHDQGLDKSILQRLGLTAGVANLEDWARVLRGIEQATQSVRVAMVGKYVELADAYKSVNESLLHAGIANQVRVDIKHVEAEDIELKGVDLLRDCDAVLVPGGFGERGFMGKLEAVRYARENKVPYLGICLGLQCAVIEYARHKAGMADASSTEWHGDTCYPVISLVDEWLDEGGDRQQRSALDNKGGTMRLGLQACDLVTQSLAHAVYGMQTIFERHRHRYEVNPHYFDTLEQAGLHISGRSKDGLVEMVELPRADHPWFLACQFHPELRSTPRAPHPIFVSFIQAAMKRGI